ncbi:MAG: integration host factor subunit beta [Candidatus Marinimicrobia bacterium]|nr:integration host factor subunit beta [Candidatus Neomarinimicrobiota bacterium]
MVKAEIVDILAEKTGLTKLETKTIVEGVIATISEALLKGDRVDLRGFGNFSVKIRKSKVARNPNTGEEVIVPERAVPVFKPSKHFIQQVDLENQKRK